MARTEASDVLHSFRFHVTTENGFGQYSDSELGEAGFQSVTLPEISTEAVEYREGIHTYTRKFPGVPTVTDMTLMRGVTKKDTSFYNWMIAGIEGGEYRTNITVYHWHRDGKQAVDKVADLNSARKYLCFECLPIRVKPAADLDATSGEVSLAEMDVAMEYFRIENAS
jgi:phage tail-like protein